MIYAPFPNSQTFGKIKFLGLAIFLSFMSDSDLFTCIVKSICESSMIIGNLIWTLFKHIYEVCIYSQRKNYRQNQKSGHTGGLRKNRNQFPQLQIGTFGVFSSAQ